MGLPSVSLASCVGFGSFNSPHSECRSQTEITRMGTGQIPLPCRLSVQASTGMGAPACACLSAKFQLIVNWSKSEKKRVVADWRRRCRWLFCSALRLRFLFVKSFQYPNDQPSESERELPLCCGAQQLPQPEPLLGMGKGFRTNSERRTIRDHTTQP